MQKLTLLSIIATGLLTFTSCSKDTTINEGDTFIILTGANNPFELGEEEVTEVKFNYVPVSGNDGTKGKTSTSSKGSTAKIDSNFEHKFAKFDLFLTWENAPGGARTIKLPFVNGITDNVMLPVNGTFTYEFIAHNYNAKFGTALGTSNTASNTFHTGVTATQDVAIIAQTRHSVITVNSTTATITAVAFDTNNNLNPEGHYVLEGLTSVISVTFTFEGETYTAASGVITTEAYNHYDYTLNVQKGEDVAGNVPVDTSLVITLENNFSTVSETITYITEGDVEPDDEGDFTLETEVTEDDVMTVGGDYIVTFNGVQFNFQAKLTTIDGGTVFAYVDQHELVDGTEIYHAVMQDDGLWKHVTVDKTGTNTYELRAITNQYAGPTAKGAVAWVFNNKVIPLLD